MFCSICRDLFPRDCPGCSSVEIPSCGPSFAAGGCTGSTQNTNSASPADDFVSVSSTVETRRSVISKF